MSAFTSALNSTINFGNSQRQLRGQLHGEQEEAYKSLMPMLEQNLFITEETGDFMPDGRPVTNRREKTNQEIMSDPKSLEGIKEILNQPHFKRRYLGGHDLVDVLEVPGVGTSLILKNKDTGELVPMTEKGLNKGDEGYNDDKPWFESSDGILDRVRGVMLTEQRELEGLHNASDQERIMAQDAAFNEKPNSGRDRLINGDSSSDQIQTQQQAQLGSSAQSFPAGDFGPQVTEGAGDQLRIGELNLSSSINSVNTNDAVKGHMSRFAGSRPEVIEAAARRAGIPVNDFVQLATSVLHQESSGKANSKSPKGADGLMQIMPKTGRDPGFRVKPLNADDPDDNIRFGVEYLAAMIERYDGDVEKGLAAYNAGYGKVDEYGGIPPYAETQKYVPEILSRLGQASAPEVQPDSSPEPESGLGEAELGGGDVPDQAEPKLSAREQVLQNRKEHLGTPDQAPDAQDIYRGGRDTTVVAPAVKEVVDRRTSQAKEGGTIPHVLGSIAGGALEMPGALARDVVGKVIGGAKETASVAGDVVGEVAETAKVVADSEFGRGMTGKESKATVTAREEAAREADTSAKKVVSEVSKPIETADPETSHTLLDKTMEQMEGLPVPKDTQLMARWKQAMTRPVSQNYIHHLALAQRRGYISSAQAHQMFDSAQQASAKTIELETAFRTQMANADKAEVQAYKERQKAIEAEDIEAIAANSADAERGVKFLGRQYEMSPSVSRYARSLGYKDPAKGANAVITRVGAVAQKYPHMVSMFYGGIDINEILKSGEMSAGERVHFDQLLDDTLGSWSDARGKAPWRGTLGLFGGKPEDTGALNELPVRVDVRGEVAPGLSVGQAINDAAHLMMQRGAKPEEIARIRDELTAAKDLDEIRVLLLLESN